MKLCPSIGLGLGQDIIVSYVKVSPRTIFYTDCNMKLCLSIGLGLGQDFELEDTNATKTPHRVNWPLIPTAYGFGSFQTMKCENLTWNCGAGELTSLHVDMLLTKSLLLSTVCSI